MNQIILSKSTKIYFAAFVSQKTKKNKVFSIGQTFWSVFSWNYFMRDRFSFSGNSVPFRRHEIMKFSSTEPKFDIFIKNITGKNTFLNSKNAFLYFACLFRPWVISARAVSSPSYFNLWIFLS